MREVGGIVRATHERWDGAGYGDGLAATSIPLAARIIAVCDAYAAMTSDRPYRRAISADGRARGAASLRGRAVRPRRRRGVLPPTRKGAGFGRRGELGVAATESCVLS